MASSRIRLEADVQDGVVISARLVEVTEDRIGQRVETITAIPSKINMILARFRRDFRRLRLESQDPPCSSPS